MCPFLNYQCQHWPCMFFIVPHPSLSFHWLICFSLLCICFNIASIFVFFCFFAPCFSACVSSVALYQWLEADRQGRDPDIAATGKAPSMLLHLTVWMLVRCLFPMTVVAVWFHGWYWFNTQPLIETDFMFFSLNSSSLSCLFNLGVRICLSFFCLFKKAVLPLTRCP